MTGDYEQGFAEGERQAFIERNRDRHFERFVDAVLEASMESQEYRRGWRDGLVPRSATWHRPNARAFCGVAA